MNINNCYYYVYIMLILLNNNITIYTDIIIEM